MLANVIHAPSTALLAARRTATLSLGAIDGLLSAVFPTLLAPVDPIAREAWALDHVEGLPDLAGAAGTRRARTS